MAYQSNEANKTIDQLVSEVSIERLMEVDRAVSQWERLSGSPEERKAFDYLEKTLRQIGLETHRYNPVCLVSLPGPASLTISASGEEITCITHSFSTATDSLGISGEVVYVGSGSPADYESKEVAGKIVLIDGLAGPGKVAPAERHGAIGVINISGPEIHEMIISPVWGSPNPGNVDTLPKLPHVSIDNASGDKLKAMLATGTLAVDITTEVDTGWRPLPTLVGSLMPSKATDQYVLFSGHVDSWYYGAMDNGSANASMVETVRILAGHRDLLRREVRIAFWSGHSHARYGSSAWFADEFWQDLNDHCVAHVNIDSPGGIGATVLTEANTMGETYDLARELIGYLTDQELNYARISRMGDQSFWGVGIPSLYCSISNQPAEGGGPDLESAIGGGRRRAGGLGWWWHTPDDTIDKIDPEFLARDCRILLATVYRVASDPVLPFDQSGPAKEIQRAVQSVAEQAGDAFDLADVQADAEALVKASEKLSEACRGASDDETVDRLNRCLVKVSRILIPVNYTLAGRFDQDPALSFGTLPGLRVITELAKFPDGSPERYLRLTSARRERNRLRAALIEARQTIDAALAG